MRLPRQIAVNPHETTPGEGDGYTIVVPEPDQRSLMGGSPVAALHRDPASSFEDSLLSRLYAPERTDGITRRRGAQPLLHVRAIPRMCMIL
jgi:hypothetical protein